MNLNNPEEKRMLDGNTILAQSPWATKWGNLFLLEDDKARDYNGNQIYNSWWCNTGSSITPFCNYGELKFHQSFDEMSDFILRAGDAIKTVENGWHSFFIKNAWDNMNKVDLWNYLIMFVKAYNKEQAELIIEQTKIV